MPFETLEAAIRLEASPIGESIDGMSQVKHNWQC